MGSESPTAVDTEPAQTRVAAAAPAVSGRGVAEAFVALADTLVTGSDAADFTRLLAGHSVELLGVDAAGLLVTDQRGELRLMAASGERARSLELSQLRYAQGPCLDCLGGGEVVHCPDLYGAEARRSWPRFAQQARGHGFAAVSALPLRVREEVIGVLDLFREMPGDLHADTVALGQALADMATIGLLHERAVRAERLLAEQLRSALTSRVVIEQAKGVLAERHGWAMEEAFARLRGHARDHNRRLAEVAREVVSYGGDLDDPSVERR
ncbi:GAF and ANTAR domain-containing protein [Nonomuraea aurantiaca]|uniref:GAF and ANTAR domain-containing protein n=1 Tax=Nonomuraea aurantiaca TaxID=2878562 RepID=UPI001CDA4ECC|nr:GAF and ANTAR domain-containing protein [Nonomuraea aurantiaca]MCA2223718.1 GAF and ANTAR domain-containing protein [Nonomuraea aurantiaca]